MDLFSKRMGITKAKLLQFESMDTDLRNSIWNFIYEEVLTLNDDVAKRFLCRYFFKEPTDKIKRVPAVDWLNEKYTKMDWWEIYNLLEFVIDNYLPLIDSERIIRNNTRNRSEIENKIGRQYFEIKRKAQQILEEENAGYRFIEGNIVPITNNVEIDEINHAIRRADELEFDGAKLHLGRAIELLSLKPKPDSRNSIKESISAVESVASLIAGQSQANLGAALNTLKQRGVYIHPAMDEAFKRLFGYASDENGIRHAILDDSEPSFDEAKFMVVACSAFVNFLILKKAEASFTE